MECFPSEIKVIEVKEKKHKFIVQNGDPSRMDI
jgi:hypothetical protein